MKLSLKQYYYETRDGTIITLSVDYKKSSGKYFSLDYNWPFVGFIHSTHWHQQGRWNTSGKYCAPSNPRQHPLDIVAKSSKKEFDLYQENLQEIKRKLLGN